MICSRCGVSLTDDLAPGPCGRCLSSPPFQQQTVSLFHYQGPVRDAILGWKLGGDDAAVQWLIETSGPRLKALIQPMIFCYPSLCRSLACAEAGSITPLIWRA